ncbi:MAG: excinuclease ABC subunit UvrC [Clostridia bacterium]|nr:excinuclease ABC subunit UvrC [Clostridia bacterium]
MKDYIKEKLHNLPTKSGVYIMKDIDGNVIYVGKAKNLKNRVSQYFNNKPEKNANGYTFKVKAMVDKIFDFEYFITLSELDALALESNLIKKHQPFFNILLKDGKSFPYIKIDTSKPFPKPEIVRKVKKDGAKYFGPYFAGIKAFEVLKIINSAFLVRTCNLKIEKSKPQPRECLNYMLNLCSAPCTNKISEKDYDKIIAKVIEFLNGNDNLILHLLQEKMLIASENENFEKALELRENIKMVQKLKQKVVAQVPQNKEIDVFAYATNNISGAISLLVVRGGKILGVQNLTTVDASLDEGETLSSFILQYYANAKVPEIILISHNIEDINNIETILTNKRKPQIYTAMRGYKKYLLDMAKANAKEHLEKSATVEKTKFNETIGAIQNLKKELGLLHLPKRIECYDISNTQGTNSVASMVVFINGDKAKKHYRKFKINTVEGPNDFESLKEVITRRLIELDKCSDESFCQKPDLILIDGGKGQLSITANFLFSIRNDIEIISLAKKFEEVFKPNNPTPIMLKRASVELRLLQNLRDEAHRFAITFHRNLRQKKSLASPLDDIKGVGKVKKDALIKQFKTIEEIKKASPEELALVKGIDKNLANKIKEFFEN